MSIKRNTLINLIGAIVPMAVMLFTVPLYLAQLGEARYGVLALVWLVLGYFSFLEMGLGKATANQIAKAHDAPNAERSEIFWTALLINAAMGMVGAGILWLIGEYLLTSVLKMPADFRQEAVAALPWIIATLPLALVSSVLNGSLEGRNQFLAVNVLQILSNTIFQIAPLVMAYWYSPSLEVVIPAAVLSRAVMNLPFLIACLRVVPFTITPTFSVVRAKSLFSFGGWVAVSGIVSPLMETIDRFLIGVILGAKAVAHYTIAYQLATKVRILPASLSRALFPRFSSDPTKASEVAVESFSALLAIMTPVIVLCVLLVGPFLANWVGTEVSHHATPVAQTILLGVWANSLAHIPFNLLQAIGRPGLVAKLHVAELLPFVAILYFSTTQWGVIGAAGAWTARVIADSVLLYLAAGIAKDAAQKAAIPLAMVSFAMIIVSMVDTPSTLIWLGLILMITVAAWMCTTPFGTLIRVAITSCKTSNAK